VLAEYRTNDELVKTIIWDDVIVQNGTYNNHHQQLDFQHRYAKYFLEHVKDTCGSDIALKFYWNVIPYSGLIQYQYPLSKYSHKFTFANKNCE
jgi:hypothetical protein